MSSSELQAFLSNLKPRSREQSSVSPAAVEPAQQSSRLSSSSFFPLAQASSPPPPPFSSIDKERASSMNPAPGQPRAASSATAQNLLNLLNFGTSQNNAHSSIHSASASVDTPTTQHNEASHISASDLVAKFISPTTITTVPEQKEDHKTHAQSDPSTSRGQLLELLNKQATAGLSSSALEIKGNDEAHHRALSDADIPVQSVEISADSFIPNSTEDRRESPVRIFGSAASRGATPFEPRNSASPMPQGSKPIFTYTNPFEALNASRHFTPKAPSPAPPQSHLPQSFEFQPTPGLSSPTVISTRKKLTPKLRTQRSSTPANRDQSPAEMPESSVAQSDKALGAKDIQPSIETLGAVPKSHETNRDPVTDPDGPKGFEQPVSETLTDNLEGSGEWEDAEESPDGNYTQREVPVYNFPIKAFVSITLQLKTSCSIGIREDGVMEISRLKKDFDQLDRSLAAATSKYITYAFVKNGGMRIIRQDDGSDRHVFKNSHDRIFNVAFCTTAVTSAPSDNQAILGTGVSGAVYYANVCKEGNDLFEKNLLDSESLIFPPFPQADENTAGGVLKTRAKRSSRHPEYFAIGRGKSIHIVWPATALSPRYGISDANREVDVEKFYGDRPLQISTGKAGKDFTFSEDDTLIVSLDKTGRLRFWDIRPLVDEANATAARVSPVVIDTPILSLSTASPAEKSWPTSVTFVDKARPFKKGGALRYVLVGLRQNHTLQLWDIALGKAVQEVNFPHENETDGICSVSYHPESGIIAVGHPTRNSIFFIHLSAPRYTLSSHISQANYVSRIAAKDPELPKPDSTACMSGIREISFASKGELRSMELLPVQKNTETSKDETASLFELYVVHSKGVTCLGINKEDLGWNAENKVLHPIDAQKDGLVSLKELKLGSVIEETTRSKSPVKDAPQPSKPSKQKAKKQMQASKDVPNGTEESSARAASPIASSALPTVTEAPLPEPVVQETPVPKESKKAKRKAEKAAQFIQNMEPISTKTDVGEPSPTKVTSVQSNGQREVPNEDAPISESKVAASVVPVIGLEKELARIEHAVSVEFKNEFDILYRNIQADRAAQESSSASRQETILKLVSNSLSTNVEKSLSRIITQQIQQAVVPAVIQHTSAQVADTISQHLRQILPQEIGTQLPSAISAALQSSNTSRAIADSVSHKLSKQLESQVAEMVVKSVTPVFKSIATSAAEKATSDTETRLIAQMRQLQVDRISDTEKLDKLSSVLQGMASTLQAMSDSQVAFQGQILRDRQSLTAASGSGTLSNSRQVSTARGTPDVTPIAKPRPVRARSKADIELEEVTNLMTEGRYEEGSIKWLQSTQPVKLFDELFVRFTPEYLATDVSPLVAFSVAVTVANSLNTNTERRLEWISAAFDAVDLQDPEISDLSQHAPALITSLVQKLESLYMTIAERNPADSMLRTIPLLAKKGRDMKTAFIARAAEPVSSSFSHLVTGSH